MANGPINFTAQQEVRGTFDPATGRTTFENTNEAKWLFRNGAGNLGEAERSKIREALAERPPDKIDVAPMKDRVAQAAEKKWDGRYTPERPGEEVGLGSKGDRVRTRQQELVDNGYDIGNTGKAKNGVDGYWGDRTERAWKEYSAKKAGDTAESVTGDLENDSPDAVDASKKLNALSNSEVAAVDTKMKEQTGDGLEDQVAKMDGVPGNNADMRDWLQLRADGTRFEGPAAAAEGPAMEQLQRGLLESRTDPRWGMRDGWGTDEKRLNRVLHDASDAQLAELDRRLRTGIQDGSTKIRFDDGLRGFIDSEVGGGAHRDSLMARVKHALERPQ
jgi:hypothetical protein